MFFFKIIFFIFFIINFYPADTKLMRSKKYPDFSKIRNDEVLHKNPKPKNTTPKTRTRTSCKPWEYMPNFNDRHPPSDCICITTSE